MAKNETNIIEFFETPCMSSPLEYMILWVSDEKLLSFSQLICAFMWNIKTSKLILEAKD